MLACVPWQRVRQSARAIDGLQRTLSWRPAGEPLAASQGRRGQPRTRDHLTSRCRFPRGFEPATGGQRPGCTTTDPVCACPGCGRSVWGVAWAPEKFFLGGGGASEPLIQPPPPPPPREGASEGRLSFFHVSHAYPMTKPLALSQSVPVPVPVTVSLQEGGGGHPPLVVSRSITLPPPPCVTFRRGAVSLQGPWTVTRSSLRMLRRVAAFCRPLRPVLPLVSFPRSRSPVVWCVGAVLDVAGCAVCASAAPNNWRIGGCAGCCRAGCRRGQRGWESVDVAVGSCALGLPNSLFGGLGGPRSPCSGGGLRGPAVLFPCFSCVSHDKTTGTATVCPCHCHGVTPKGRGVLLRLSAVLIHPCPPPPQPPDHQQVGAQKKSDIGGVFAQRGHSARSANYHGDYPGNNPENHTPAESCTINSKLKNSNI